MKNDAVVIYKENHPGVLNSLGDIHSMFLCPSIPPRTVSHDVMSTFVVESTKQISLISYQITDTRPEFVLRQHHDTHRTATTNVQMT